MKPSNNKCPRCGRKRRRNSCLHCRQDSQRLVARAKELLSEHRTSESLSAALVADGYTVGPFPGPEGTIIVNRQQILIEPHGVCPEWVGMYLEPDLSEPPDPSRPARWLMKIQDCEGEIAFGLGAVGMLNNMSMPEEVTQ